MFHRLHKITTLLFCSILQQLHVSAGKMELVRYLLGDDKKLNLHHRMTCTLILNTTDHPTKQSDLILRTIKETLAQKIQQRKQTNGQK